VRWHRVEAEPGVYDWRHTDEVFEWMGDAGLAPIVDLLHHTSYPRWVEGFTDPRFGPAFLRFVEEVARRYPWISEYTLCNEPFTTFFLCGHEGLWPPHLRGMRGFVEVAGAVLPVLSEASRRCRELLPHARHVWVDVCERHNALTEDAVEYAAFANDRRFFVLDAFLGLPLDEMRPFVRAVAEAGGDALLDMEPGHVDVVGLDYYAHCQWDFLGPHGEGRMHSVEPVPLAALIVEYADRYQRPVALTETNVRGYASDRASWLKYTLEQCELAQDAGVEVDGYCWFPFVDSCDWDSTLCRCEGNVDPVGVYWLDESLERRPSCMSESWERAAQGASAAELPAFRFREPVAGWLRGWLPQMAHWQWQDPPVYPSDPPPPEGPVELRIPDVVE
jgi:beta-glucosidase/6-phospho-beta-glucosidase/beta-galactosidase